MTSQAMHPDGAAGAGADLYAINVEIDPAYEAALDINRLHRLAGFVLQAAGRRAALEVGVTVTNDEEIHTLNKQYLGHDDPTDVLSFGAEAPSPTQPAEGTASDSAQASAVRFVTPPGWPTYLGDVVISYDTAAAQAADYGHDAAAEVDVLLVHGLLHLLGYDDHAPADRARMHRRQDELLAAFE